MPAENSTSNANGSTTTVDPEIVTDHGPTGMAHRMHHHNPGAPGTHVMVHRNVMWLGAGVGIGVLLTLWLTGAFRRR